MARRRSARRPDPDLDEDMDDDEFAWQPKKKKTSRKKSATGKKKRTKSATGSTKRSSSTSKTSSSGKRPSSASNKASGKRASSKLSGSSVRKKSGRTSGKRRRSSEDDDAADSGRRRAGRSGRPPIPRKKQGFNPIVLISIVTGTILLCVIIAVAMNSGPKKIVEDQPAQLQQADALAGEAEAAYRKWNKAKSEGNAQAELAAWREAHTKFTQALDMYNTVLDKYRGADDQLPPEYEGYEGALSNMSKLLIDLEKGSRTDAMDNH